MAWSPSLSSGSLGFAQEVIDSILEEEQHKISELAMQLQQQTQQQAAQPTQENVADVSVLEPGEDEEVWPHLTRSQEAISLLRENDFDTTLALVRRAKGRYKNTDQQIVLGGILINFLSAIQLHWDKV